MFCDQNNRQEIRISKRKEKGSGDQGRELREEEEMRYRQGPWTEWQREWGRERKKESAEMKDGRYENNIRGERQRERNWRGGTEKGWRRDIFQDAVTT